MEGMALSGELKPPRGLEPINLAHTALAGLCVLHCAFLLYHNDCPPLRAVTVAVLFFTLGWLAYLLSTSVLAFASPALQRTVGLGRVLFLVGQVATAGWAALALRRGAPNCPSRWAFWLRIYALFGALGLLAAAARLLLTGLRRLNRRRYLLGHPQGAHVDHAEDYAQGEARAGSLY